MTAHFNMISEEMDSIANQNILLQTKLDSVYDKSKQIINLYHKQLSKIHSINETSLLKISNQS
jgi:hypothetical protein